MMKHVENNKTSSLVVGDKTRPVSFETMGHVKWEFLFMENYLDVLFKIEIFE